MPIKPYNQDFFNNIASEFDNHVKQSIPLFSQFQAWVAQFIADKFSNYKVADICGSTGELGRQLLFSGWKGSYTCLDGSPMMQDVFNKVTPKASQDLLSFKLAGFGGGWNEDYQGNDTC